MYDYCPSESVFVTVQNIETSVLCNKIYSLKAVLFCHVVSCVHAGMLFCLQFFPSCSFTDIIHVLLLSFCVWLSNNICGPCSDGSLSNCDSFTCGYP